MDQTPDATPQPTPAGELRDDEPTVASEVDRDTARLTISGELTDAARRPLVRTLTDILLAEHALQRVELQLRDVAFMNSAGLAVLVQLQKMAVPRGIEMVLVEPTAAVSRSLQLTGLWHRFTVVQADGEVSEPYGEGTPRSGPRQHS
ncbi:STAS domain-containing protein [Blastococcus saxobsidens]|uniref:Anti-sigma factor antagonist n=1 Tax=Blastococcus saxobsidens TaxID=138336 RepID=A0A6L9W0Y1_9ACTN|nr:STAS domain-containing protein [Blastococcus saxobsidens]